MDNSIPISFPDTPMKRVRLTFVIYPDGWGLITGWRLGSGEAPPMR